ncbi:phage Gp37/Gp68 family protein [Paraburkholderia largidicola]|uniref:Phage Gp37/Gp68 family protein n=1 Tax=Paraburkholderia largidicola TaxID=3014751 RepID=A0A7I8BJW4_9BURK|nr:phage Gp37/Gp68 family protein [Paraburkholderia sp. PGU16]BCF88728.1 hypothetical protein PPGU16_17950 [Paraburkholderia sp. PGU16]
MSENSKIEWTDHTFNPWEGCQKVGPGCDHCYAEARNARFAGGAAINWGPGAPRRRTSAANWRKPLQWDKAHAEFFAQHGRRQRVFCASLADVFDNAVPDAWRMDLFKLIGDTPNLDWLVLTKRIGNVRPYTQRDGLAFDLIGDGRVWLGATIINQAEADRDIPKLLEVPAAVRFLSIEPMLGPIDLRRYLDPTGITCMDVCPDSHYIDVDAVDTSTGGDEVVPLCQHCGAVASWTGFDDGIDWVIAGGESGHGARPMHPYWARSLRDQCAAANVPFLFKQWGEWYPASIDSEDDRIYLPDGSRVPLNDEEGNTRIQSHLWSSHWSDPVTCYDISARIGKKAAGRLLDGRTHDEFPE